MALLYGRRGSLAAELLDIGRDMQRLQGRVRFELQVPPAPHKDFNDQLTSRGNTR